MSLSPPVDPVLAPPPSPVFPLVCPTINWFSRVYGGEEGTYTILQVYWDYEYVDNFFTSRTTTFKTEAELIDFILENWRSNTRISSDQFPPDEDEKEGEGVCAIDFYFPLNKFLGRRVGEDWETYADIAPEEREPIFAEVSAKAKANPTAFFRCFLDIGNVDLYFVKEGLVDRKLERKLEKVSDILLDLEDDSDSDY